MLDTSVLLHAVFLDCVWSSESCSSFFPLLWQGSIGVLGLHPWAACTHGQSSGHVPYVFLSLITVQAEPTMLTSH